MPDPHKKKKNKRSRATFLRDMVLKYDFKRGAELGVRTGNTSFFLLNQCEKLTMYMVDNWTPGERNTNWEQQPQSYKDCWERFQKNKFLQSSDVKNRAILLKMDTVDASEKIDDGSLDFVFIDADHKYSNVLADILAWIPKVRFGGMISGHDYGGLFKGVTKAVNETFGSKVEVAGYDEVWYTWKE